MRIQAGYEIAYDCARPTPMLLMLRVHPSRQTDLETPERITFDPPVRATEYKDGFGNLRTRITAPPGRFTISNAFPAGSRRCEDEASLIARDMDVRAAAGLVGEITLGDPIAAPLLADEAGARARHANL